MKNGSISFGGEKNREQSSQEGIGGWRGGRERVVDGQAGQISGKRLPARGLQGCV